MTLHLQIFPASGFVIYVKNKCTMSAHTRRVCRCYFRRVGRWIGINLQPTVNECRRSSPDSNKPKYISSRSWWQNWADLAEGIGKDRLAKHSRYLESRRKRRGGRHLRRWKDSRKWCEWWIIENRPGRLEAVGGDNGTSKTRKNNQKSRSRIRIKSRQGEKRRASYVYS